MVFFVCFLLNVQCFPLLLFWPYLCDGSCTCIVSSDKLLLREYFSFILLGVARFVFLLNFFLLVVCPFFFSSVMFVWFLICEHVPQKKTKQSNNKSQRVGQSVSLDCRFHWLLSFYFFCFVSVIHFLFRWTLFCYFAVSKLPVLYFGKRASNLCKCALWVVAVFSFVTLRVVFVINTQLPCFFCLFTIATRQQKDNHNVQTTSSEFETKSEARKQSKTIKREQSVKETRKRKGKTKQNKSIQQAP